MAECEDYYTHNPWELVMDETGFYLKQEVEGNIYSLAERKRNNKLKILSTINQQDIIFLDEYDEVNNNFAYIYKRKFICNEL